MCTPSDLSHPTIVPHRPRVGWIVDVQNDFMRPADVGGRLYVHDLTDARDPGAQQIVPALVRTVAWMRTACAVVVYTGDWHAYGDREIDPVAPDFQTTYPPHCMGMSEDPAEREGAAILEAVRPTGDLRVLRRDATPAEGRALAREAVARRVPVFVQKNEFSVFAGNPATDAFLAGLTEALGATPELVVCGVATDVCVRQAVEGFLDASRAYPVTVVIDAIWGLGLAGPTETTDAWAARGAVLTTSHALVASGAPMAGCTVHPARGLRRRDVVPVLGSVG